MSAGQIGAALESAPGELGARLLELSESQWFDRKSARIEPRKLAESIVAFANADGGTIVVGISNGVVEGVDADPQHLNALQQAAIDFTAPTVPVQSRLYPCLRSDETRDHVLVIEVPSGRVAYATHRDDAYLRIGDENRRLSFDQRRELFYDKNQSAFESEATALGVEDLDAALVSSYAQAMGAADDFRLLEARDLLRAGTLTVAGTLLFAERPEKAIPSAQLRVIRYQGTQRHSGERQNIVGDERIEGPIPVIFHRSRERIREWQPTRRALTATGRFDAVGLVPEDAWLEGVVNALVHRSYSQQGDYIRVELYDDRIVIESPGRFPGLVDPSRPLSISRFARNPRVARVCTDLRITQELGEGIRRMFDEMRRVGLSDPLYRQTAGSVVLTLSGVPLERALIDALPQSQQRILGVLREASALSTGEIVELTKLARPTVLRHLAVLRQSGYVEWVGKSPKDPRASWRHIH